MNLPIFLFIFVCFLYGYFLLVGETVGRGHSWQSELLIGSKLISVAALKVLQEQKLC